MHQLITKRLKQLNIDGTFSPDDQIKAKTITSIAVPPVLLLLFFGGFAIVTKFYNLAVFNAVAILIIFAGVYLVWRFRFGAGKAVISCAVTLTCFIYFKQFDTEYYVFCYFIPLVFGIFLFFDFSKELRSFYVVCLFILLCIILSLLSPPYLFGNPHIPLLVKPVSQMLNILFSTLLFAAYMAILIRGILTREKELVRAKETAEAASRVKAAFLSNMSHELRTPLNGITGTAHILQNEPFLEAQKNHITVLRHLSEHMTGLINDILDYSKMEAGKFELHKSRFNLRDIFKKLYFIFRNTVQDKALFFTFDTDDRFATIEMTGDELRLMQVMTNLISNALKFTEKGGITVYANIITESNGRLTLQAGVKDTGIGIKKMQLEHIFESFSQADSAATRKYGGTGLGLTISKNIIEMSGGKLLVESEYGKGSNFYFEIDLPFAEAQVRHTQAEAPVQKKLGDLKVLLAEDNPINMIVAKKILERWNVRVTEAVNGVKAVAAFRQEHFDMVLLDLEMPEMDGRQAAQIIKRENPQMPLIAFTAAFYENITDDLKQFGFSDYVPKPFKPEDLHKKIFSVL